MMDQLPQVIEPCVKCQDCQSPSAKKNSAHSEGPLGHVKARSSIGDRVCCSIHIYAISTPYPMPRSLALPHVRESERSRASGAVALGARLRSRAADRGTE